MNERLKSEKLDGTFFNYIAKLRPAGRDAWVRQMLWFAENRHLLRHEDNAFRQEGMRASAPFEVYSPVIYRVPLHLQLLIGVPFTETLPQIVRGGRRPDPLPPVVQNGLQWKRTGPYYFVTIGVV